MSEELKPCPFCGGEALANRDIVEADEWSIDCGVCSVYVTGADEAAAIAAWNRRHQGEGVQQVGVVLNVGADSNDGGNRG